MTIEFIILSLIGLMAYSFFIGRKKALALSSLKNVTVHSQPYYHGLYSALITIFPAFILLILWSWIESSIFSINLREYFKDIADPAVADFYILGVINFAGGIDEKVMNHVNFMSAVNYYESTIIINLISKFSATLLATFTIFSCDKLDELTEFDLTQDFSTSLNVTVIEDSNGTSSNLD